MKKKNQFFIVAIVIISFNNDLISQAWRVSCNTWAAGDAIGAVKFITSPNAQILRTCAGVKIPFAVSFGDLDDANCPAGTWKMQYPHDFAYRITFTTTNGTFQNGLNTITVGFFATTTELNPFSPPDRYQIISSESAVLTIDPAWDGMGDINVTVTITDMALIPPPGCDLGNPRDPDFVYVWTINSTVNIPMNINHIPPPAYNLFFFGGGTGVTYTYEATSIPAQNFNGGIVNETFGMIASGFFTFDDVLPLFKAAHPDLLSADDVANFIFEPGNPHAFAIDMNNRFDDTHSGYRLRPGLDFAAIFTEPCITNNRVVYRLPQTYSVCGIKKSMQNVYRRIWLSANPGGNPIGTVSIRKGL